jgi:hypothetical protein
MRLASYVQQPKMAQLNGVTWKEFKVKLTVNRFLKALVLQALSLSTSSAEVFGPCVRNWESERRDMLGTATCPGASSTRSFDITEYV